MVRPAVAEFNATLRRVTSRKLWWSCHRVGAAGYSRLRRRLLYDGQEMMPHLLAMFSKEGWLGRRRLPALTRWGMGHSNGVIEVIELTQHPRGFTTLS